MIKMNKKMFLATAFAVTVLVSCNQGNKGYQDAESFSKLNTELTDKFGKDAYYTDFGVTNSDNGNIVTVTQTDKPSSLKMAQWSNVNGDWKQSAEVSLEVSPGAKAEDFMFQLGKTVKMDLLGKLVEQSKQKVISEKKINEVTVESVIIKAPNDGDFNSMRYFITIKPKQGGTSFNFWYKMDGTLDKFDF